MSDHIVPNSGLRITCNDDFMVKYERSADPTLNHTPIWQVHCDRRTLICFIESQYGTTFCSRFMSEVKPVPGTEGWTVQRFLVPLITNHRLRGTFHRKCDAELNASRLRELAAWTWGRLGRECFEVPRTVEVTKRQVES